MRGSGHRPKWGTQDGSTLIRRVTNGRQCQKPKVEGWKLEKRQT